MAADLAELGVTIDTSKQVYSWVGSDDEYVYYYQFTDEELMDTSTITDLDSHMIAAKAY